MTYECELDAQTLRPDVERLVDVTESSLVVTLGATTAIAWLSSMVVDSLVSTSMMVGMALEAGTILP